MQHRMLLQFCLVSFWLDPISDERVKIGDFTRNRRATKIVTISEACSNQLILILIPVLARSFEVGLTIKPMGLCQMFL